MDWGGWELVHGIPVSVDEHSHSALCLSSFAETVWPAEPEGFTAKLQKTFTTLISTKRETLASVFVRHYSILLNGILFYSVKKAHFLGICYQCLAVIIRWLKGHSPDNPVPLKSTYFLQLMGPTESAKVHLCLCPFEGLLNTTHRKRLFLFCIFALGDSEKIKIRHTM